MCQGQEGIDGQCRQIERGGKGRVSCPDWNAKDRQVSCHFPFRVLGGECHME